MTFMKLYADRPGTAARQLLFDVAIVAWIGFWVWLATKVYALTEKLAVPGQKLEHAGAGLAGGLSDAGDKVGSVPAIGDALASPLNKAAGAARALSDAGAEQQQVVHELAWLLALLVLLWPAWFGVTRWLVPRIRWVRRATVGAALRGTPAGRDLLALRALSNQPLRRLARVSDNPVGQWRDGDESIVDTLAALELRTLGLRNPYAVPQPRGTRRRTSSTVD